MAFKSRKSLMRVILIGIPAGFISFIFLSWFSAYTFTSSNHTKIIMPDTIIIEKEDVTFKTADGLNIKGWYFKNDRSRRAVVLLHGWKANRMETLPRVKFLYQAGYNILIYDARACGESEGEKVSIGYYETEDLTAAVKFLKEKNNTKIGCIGISQGGATAIYTAGKIKDINCVISESAYSTIQSAVNNRFLYYLKIPGNAFGYFIIKFAEIMLQLNAEEMKPAEKIRHVFSPVFIISGKHDTRTLEANTIELYNNANQPKKLWLIPGAGHEDLFRHQGLQYEKYVLEFLARALAE